MSQAALSEFDRATAVQPLGDGAYAASMDTGWWVVRGPNGGYVAAVMLRALADAAGDADRAPRSLTVHYASAPAEGPVRIETTVERRGRSLSSLAARMTQDDELVALALAAFSAPWPDRHDFDGLTPPLVGRPGEGALPDRPRELLPPIAQRWDFRGTLGAAPFAGADEAETGGWLRLAEPRVADSLVVAAMTDAWFPAAFTRLTEPVALPTIDLTIHFRAPLPLAGARPDDWFLAAFRSRQAREGFVEEDGEIWSASGELVAQSRQLALMI